MVVWQLPSLFALLAILDVTAASSTAAAPFSDRTQNVRRRLESDICLATEEAKRVTNGVKKAVKRDIVQVKTAVQRDMVSVKKAVKRDIVHVKRDIVHAADVTVHNLERAKVELHSTWSALPAAEELPSWVHKELQARLKPRRLPPRFPGQEFIVRPMRRALAWRRADKLVRSDAIADLSGTWKLEERIAMDEFLREEGFSALQRAVVLKAGQVQVLALQGGELKLLTRDCRGTFELALPLNGPGRVSDDGGDEPIRRCAFIEGHDIVITEKGARSGQTVSVCRRSLQPDGRMCVDVRKRNRRGDGFVSMRVIFTPVED